MMKQTIISGLVLAGCLCSNAKPSKTTPTTVKVKTPAQAVNIARLHYINGHRGIRYSGKPNSILNWTNPKITRTRSRQNNPLWRVHFKVPSGAALPTDDFIIVVAENGKVHHIIQAGD